MDLYQSALWHQARAIYRSKAGKSNAAHISTVCFRHYCLLQEIILQWKCTGTLDIAQCIHEKLKT